MFVMKKERHNKFQVLKCPWCGTKMVKDDKNGRLVGEWGYNMSGKHFYMFCPHEDCAFTKRLPIQIIDDELYETPPTLLFGTVDKFAMRFLGTDELVLSSASEKIIALRN